MQNYEQDYSDGETIEASSNVQQTSLHGLDIKNYFETHQISHTLRPWDLFNIWRTPQRIFINLNDNS